MKVIAFNKSNVLVRLICLMTSVNPITQSRDLSKVALLPLFLSIVEAKKKGQLFSMPHLTQSKSILKASLSHFAKERQVQKGKSFGH